MKNVCTTLSIMLDIGDILDLKKKSTNVLKTVNSHRTLDAGTLIKHIQVSELQV